jgi:hypothetical protein
MYIMGHDNGKEMRTPQEIIKQYSTIHLPSGPIFHMWANFPHVERILLSYTMKIVPIAWITYGMTRYLMVMRGLFIQNLGKILRL